MGGQSSKSQSSLKKSKLNNKKKILKQFKNHLRETNLIEENETFNSSTENNAPQIIIKLDENEQKYKDQNTSSAFRKVILLYIEKYEKHGIWMQYVMAIKQNILQESKKFKYQPQSQNFLWYQQNNKKENALNEKLFHKQDAQNPINDFMKRTYEDLKESKSGKNIVKDIIDVFTTYFCQNYESLLNYEGGINSLTEEQCKNLEKITKKAIKEIQQLFDLCQKIFYFCLVDTINGLKVKRSSLEQKLRKVLSKYLFRNKNIYKLLLKMHNFEHKFNTLEVKQYMHNSNKNTNIKKKFLEQIPILNHVDYPFVQTIQLLQDITKIPNPWEKFDKICACRQQIFDEIEQYKYIFAQKHNLRPNNYQNNRYFQLQQSQQQQRQQQQIHQQLQQQLQQQQPNQQQQQILLQQQQQQQKIPKQSLKNKSPTGKQTLTDLQSTGISNQVMRETDLQVDPKKFSTVDDILVDDISPRDKEELNFKEIMKLTKINSEGFVDILQYCILESQNYKIWFPQVNFIADIVGNIIYSEFFEYSAFFCNLCEALDRIKKAGSVITQSKRDLKLLMTSNLQQISQLETNNVNSTIIGNSSICFDKNQPSFVSNRLDSVSSIDHFKSPIKQEQHSSSKKKENSISFTLIDQHAYLSDSKLQQYQNNTTNSDSQTSIQNFENFTEQSLNSSQYQFNNNNNSNDGGSSFPQLSKSLVNLNNPYNNFSKYNNDLQGIQEEENDGRDTILSSEKASYQQISNLRSNQNSLELRKSLSENLNKTSSN